jgi:hypothetical protein
MKKLVNLLLSTFCLLGSLQALELMDEEFLVHYGKPQAPLKITEYFSFSCPHCLTVFKDFSKIKKEFIDKELIYLTFQPVPKDLTTIRALHCLVLLNPKEKQIFLEGLFEYLLENEENTDQICVVMQDFLTCFNKQTLAIDDTNYLKQSPIMQKAFTFVKQKDQVKALPTVEINGFLFAAEVPNYSFFAEAVSSVLGEKK